MYSCNLRYASPTLDNIPGSINAEVIKRKLLDEVEGAHLHIRTTKCLLEIDFDVKM